MIFLFSLFSDEPEIFLPKYSQTEILDASHFRWVVNETLFTLLVLLIIVGSVKVIFLSYRYRADKSTIFGMRGLWGLTIYSGRGATLKYL